MRGKKKLGAGDVALIGMMAAFLEACKAALAFLPNIELVSFWIILFTIFFRWRIWFVIPVFLLGGMYLRNGALVDPVPVCVASVGRGEFYL